MRERQMDGETNDTYLATGAGFCGETLVNFAELDR